MVAAPGSLVTTPNCQQMFSKYDLTTAVPLAVDVAAPGATASPTFDEATPAAAAAVAACVPGTFVYTTGAHGPVASDGATLQVVVDDNLLNGSGAPLSIVLCPGSVITLTAPLWVAGSSSVTIACGAVKGVWRTWWDVKTVAQPNAPKPCVLVADAIDGPMARVASPNAALTLSSLLFKARAQPLATPHVAWCVSRQLRAQRSLTQSGGDVHAVAGARVLVPECARFAVDPPYRCNSFELLPHLRQLSVVTLPMDNALVAFDTFLATVGSDSDLDHIDEKFELFQAAKTAAAAWKGDAAAARDEAAAAAGVVTSSVRAAAATACAPGTLVYQAGASTPAVSSGATLQAVIDDNALDGRDTPLSIVLCPGNVVKLDAPLRIGGRSAVSVECGTKRGWRALACAAAWTGNGSTMPCLLFADGVDGPAVRVTSINAALTLDSLLFKARHSCSKPPLATLPLQKRPRTRSRRRWRCLTHASAYSRRLRSHSPILRAEESGAHGWRCGRDRWRARHGFRQRIIRGRPFASPRQLADAATPAPAHRRAHCRGRLHTTRRRVFFPLRFYHRPDAIL